MAGLLHNLNLGDRYEFNARVLPAMVVVLPVTTLVLAMQVHDKQWGQAIGLGGGLEIFLAIVFSKLGHAHGRRLEDSLKHKWGGFPTTRWLLPEDQTHSQQQKDIWRHALEKLTGLNLSNPVEDAAERHRLFDDAILIARNKIRRSKKADLLRQHNIYYGFSRNLAGLRWYALGISSFAFIASIVGAWQREIPVATVYIEALFLIVSSGFMFRSHGYVQQCAERYAEFFFTAL